MRDIEIDKEHILLAFALEIIPFVCLYLKVWDSQPPQFVFVEKNKFLLGKGCLMSNPPLRSPLFAQSP